MFTPRVAANVITFTPRVAANVITFTAKPAKGVRTLVRPREDSPRNAGPSSHKSSTLIFLSDEQSATEF